MLDGGTDTRRRHDLGLRRQGALVLLAQTFNLDCEGFPQLFLGFREASLLGDGQAEVGTCCWRWRRVNRRGVWLRVRYLGFGAVEVNGSVLVCVDEA